MNFITHIQGDPYSSLTPLFLIHAISGVALPYFGLDSLSFDGDMEDGRPVYGISSPTIGRRNHRMPKTFDELAELYLMRIKKEVQPQGPYLLAGWSFGGMIAMKMAEILQRNNEEVLHVIMMDSPNPSRNPGFQNSREHEILASLTFGNVVKSAGRSKLSPSTSSEDSDSESYASTDVSSVDEENFNECLEKPSTARNIASGIDSNSSSDDEGDSPYSSDSEDVDNTRPSFTDSYDDSLDDEEEDEGVYGAELFSRIQNHIFGGLKLISRTKCDFYTPTWKCKWPVTLVKCKVIEPLGPLLPENRRKFIMKTFQDDRLGWDESCFEKGINIVYQNAAHDRMFDREYVAELSDILRNIVADVEFDR